MSELHRGDAVYYVPFAGCRRDQWEEGIVKRMADDVECAFVLYHTPVNRYTEGDLDNYTAACTNLSDLRHLDGRPVLSGGTEP
jgi:hypothetical protein